MIIISLLKNQQKKLIGKNTEKYTKPFSFQQKRKFKKADKNDNEDTITKTYKIKIIDCARFMVSSLSNLVDNLGEEIFKMKYKDFYCFLNMKFSMTI